jgi:hypothetical protein
MKHQKLCADLEEMLAVSYPEEDLSPSEYAALKEHLAHCSECAAIRERYVLMTAHLRALSATKPVPSSTSQLIGLKIAVHEQEATHSSFLPQPRGKQGPGRRKSPERATGPSIAATVVTLMLVLIAFVLFQRHSLAVIATISKAMAAYLAGISASALVFSVLVTGCTVVLMAVYHLLKKEELKPRRIATIAASGFVLLTIAANLVIGAIGDPATGGVPSSILKPISNTPAATNQSLLIVLLDRSGSLVQGSSATDPDGYSTSAVKALADLWPGTMAVIPFSGDRQSLPILGPYKLSDSTQRLSLKEKVQNYPVGGDTPLGPAIQEALSLLRQHGNPPGSRVIIITDGAPTGIGNNDGPHQEQNIRNDLIPQFCNQEIPISVFGLNINLNTPDGQETNQLLLDIAYCTGGTYSNMQDAANLTTPIIRLVAQWNGLSLIQENAQNGDVHISIDPFATQVEIVTFRSNSNNQVTLDGPSGQSIQGVARSSDRHYEIDTLPSRFIAGAYTIHTGGQSNARVYTLISSSLQIQLETPTLQSTAHGESIAITATFLDGGSPLIPELGQAQVVAHVRLVANGQQVGPTRTVMLVHQGAIFTGQLPVFEQRGEVSIEIDGNYYGTRRTASTSLQLTAPCSPEVLQCLWEQHRLQVTPPLAPILLLMIILLLFAAFQPRPFGYLHSKVNDTVDISLKALPRFPVGLIRRSIIKSTDIRNYAWSYKDFPFGTTKFDIIFKRGGKAFIRSAKNNSLSIGILIPDRQSSVLNQEQPYIELKPGKLRELPFGSIIVIDCNPVASFESQASSEYSH